MVGIRTKREIELIAISCQIVSDTLDMLSDHVKAGVKIIDLDKMAEEFIINCGHDLHLKVYGFSCNFMCISR
ncbi:MAG: hypothetical protein CM1200mP1_10360 [Candidatus Neomarinimicrobiota bacterium]|nr:MAG: hypothetical protein CM1200mP1_10360 [Candidatus Neomarinimicrobiota bacterium]